VSGKRLVSPLTDGDIRPIIELKSIEFSTMEIVRMHSRNESTIRSFLGKWRSQGLFHGQIGSRKKDDWADEVIEARLTDWRSPIRQVGVALAISREQVRVTWHRKNFQLSG
jgi:hypothetical protein